MQRIIGFALAWLVIVVCALFHTPYEWDVFDFIQIIAVMAAATIMVAENEF